MSGKTAKTSSKEVKEKKQSREATAEERKQWRINLVREPLVDKALEEQGLDAGGTLAEKAARLDAHYRNTIPLSSRLNCEWDEQQQTGCGFTGPATSPACPFCGLEDVDEQDARELAARAAGKSAAAVSKAAPAAEIVRPGVSPEPAEDEPADAPKLAELNRAVARVIEVHALGVGNFWDQGDALRPIHERQLYLQRRDQNGAPKYRSFRQFLAGEFGGQISPGHAFRVMDVAKTFDRTTAVEIGVAKLALLVRAKEDARPALLEKAPALTVKELHDAAKPFLIEPGQRDTGRDARPVGPGAGKGRSAGSAAVRRSAAAAGRRGAGPIDENSITVATALGAVEIPLFVKGSSDKAARKISDDPHGEEVFVNGVAAVYTLVIAPNGALKLRIVRRRVKA